MNSSLRRGMRPGLWVSQCGRFTIHRLGNGSWMVSPMHSPMGCGPFSSWLGKRLLAQRFETRRYAAQALEICLEMSYQEKAPVELEWQRHRPGTWIAPYREQVVHAKRVDGLWRVITLSQFGHQALLEAEELEGKTADQDDKEYRNRRFALDMVVKRSVGYLGSSKTLAGAKELSAEELAWLD